MEARRLQVARWWLPLERLSHAFKAWGVVANAIGQGMETTAACDVHASGAALATEEPSNRNDGRSPRHGSWNRRPDTVRTHRPRTLINQHHHYSNRHYHHHRNYHHHHRRITQHTSDIRDTSSMPPSPHIIDIAIMRHTSYNIHRKPSSSQSDKRHPTHTST